MHLKKLVKLLEDGPRAFTMVKWGGCSLLSALPMEEVKYIIPYNTKPYPILPKNQKSTP